MVHAQHRGIQGGDAVTKPLRASMPQTTAFIDALREAFGVDEINGQIKLGMAGAQTFFAEEGGQSIGTRFTEIRNHITLDKMVIKPTSPTKTTKGKR